MGRHLPDSTTDGEEESQISGSSNYNGSKRQRMGYTRHEQTTTVIPIPMLMHFSLQEGGGTGMERREDDEGAGAAPAAPRAELEALCYKCFETGVRRLYSIRLAYHAREAVVENFECPGCGYYSNDIIAMDSTAVPPQEEPGGATAMEDDGEEGSRSRPEFRRDAVSSKLNVESARDLDRRIIKSRDGALIFEEIEFEIPAVSQRGEVDTLAGFMRRAVRELSPNLRDGNVADHVRSAIETTVTQLIGYLEGNQPFTVRLDDPKGDSFIEMFDESDPLVSLTYA